MTLLDLCRFHLAIHQNFLFYRLVVLVGINPFFQLTPSMKTHTFKTGSQYRFIFFCNKLFTWQHYRLDRRRFQGGLDRTS